MMQTLDDSTIYASTSMYVANAQTLLIHYKSKKKDTLFDPFVFPVNSKMFAEGLESTKVAIKKINRQRKNVKFDWINCREKHGSSMIKFISNC